MDFPAHIEIPPAQPHCEPCHLILFGKKPATRPSPLDRTPCSHCGDPLGRKIIYTWAEIESIRGDWVMVETPEGLGDDDWELMEGPEPLGKDDWEHVERSELYSDEEDESVRSKARRSKAQPKPSTNKEDETPATGSREPQIPTIVVTDADEAKAGSSEPENAKAEAKTNASSDPITPGLRLAQKPLIHGFPFR